MTSWVARRIADLEASSDCASVYSTTSSSPARKESPAIYHRERLQVQPATTGPNETQADVDSVLPFPCEANAGGVTPTAIAAAFHQHQQQELNTNHAGGYYSRPRKQQVACHTEGAVTLGHITAGDTTNQQQQQQQEEEEEDEEEQQEEQQEQQQRQQPEITRMSSKITQLEEALLASQDRIAYLISSSAKAAENASRLRRETEAAAASEQAHARQVCQLQDTLTQAEKRASWLQGELQVVWACGTQRVGELKYELELARRQQSTEGREMITDSGGNSLSVGRPGGVLDMMMSDTQEALSNLRTKFYRAMGEKKKLKARCDHLEKELLNSVINSNIITTNNTSSNGNNTDNASTNTDNATTGSSTNMDNSRQHVREASKSSSSSSSCGKDKEYINRREEGPTNSHSSTSSSSSASASGSASGGGNSISHSINGNTTMAVEAAPVTTVGGKFSWRWPPLVRAGRR